MPFAQRSDFRDDSKADLGVLEDDNATEHPNGAVLVGHTSGLER